METKKNKNKDVKSKRGLFFQIGMICSIGISLFAFSWENSLSEDIQPFTVEDDEITVFMPATEQKKEEKKMQESPEPLEPIKKKSHLVKPVPDSVATGKPDLDTSPIVIKTHGRLIQPDTIKTEPKVFTVVEKMPVFPGGEDAMKKFVYSHFQFPGEAQEVGVQGTVFIEFIVNEYGKMTNIKIAKDRVGFGCGEEALRVINLLADKYTWTPGEQLNSKVRVKYRYPIIIKLHD